MRDRRRWFVVGVLATTFLSFQPSHAAAPTTESVVVGMATPDAGNGPSIGPSLSRDGRYLAFSTEATNLVAEDTTFTPDVLVRDRTTGATRVASVAAGGGAADGYSQLPSLSADGTRVAFESYATNLVAGDGNTFTDVFVRDLASDATVRASVSSSGAEANHFSHDAALSDDGRVVAFVSEASNLVAGDTNGVQDVFVRDLVAGITERVSVGRAGAQANGLSYQPAISGDGRYVAFASAASNLVRKDTNATHDVFVRDRLTGTTTRISPTPDGRQANGASSSPDLSADGRYLAFTSITGGITNVYLRDAVAGSVRLVSAATTGASNGNSQDPRVSDDGSVVVFDSTATNLVPGQADDLNNDVVEWRNGTLRIVSNAHDGSAAQGPSLSATIAGDASAIAFHSSAPNLVDGDTNHAEDVFVVTQSGLEWVSHSAPVPRAANGGSFDTAISGDGRFVAFSSFASNLVPGDDPGDVPHHVDVFLFDRATRTTTLVSRGFDGRPGNDQSQAPKISDDGRYVVYQTQATNIVEGVTTPGHVMIFDRTTGTNAVASVCADGSTPPAGGGTISRDGRVIAFVTDAPCTSDDTNGRTDVFVRDTTTGATELVSIGALGQGTGESFSPALDADGSVVAFTSSSAELFPGDRNNALDVFVRDRDAGVTTRVAPVFGLVDPLGDSGSPTLSADGRRIALVSGAPNLVAGDTNVCETQPGIVSVPGTCADVFLYDRMTGIFHMASVASDGTQSNSWSSTPVISIDGMRVAFSSAATNLVAGDGNNEYDVFLHDSGTGITERVSLAADGSEANGGSIWPAMDASTNLIAFQSGATNLTTDAPPHPSIYVRVRA